MRDPKHVAWLESLRACPLFSEMRTSDLEALLKIAASQRVAKDEFVFHKGGAVTGFYLVRTGAISVRRITPEGKESVIHVFRRGETFAEGALASKGYPADAVAVEESELLHFSRDDYMKLLQHRSEFALRTVVSLCQHMHQLVGHFENHQSKSAVSRLAEWLLQRCRGRREDGPVRFEIGIKKTALAAELNMRNETLSRAFARLAGEGLIEVNGSTILVPAPKRLAEQHVARNP